VTIVPEIDMPGHMTAALRAHPELQLTDTLGRRQPDKLDVTLPAARAFAADLVREYLALFPGPWWHSGSDEYLGIASTPADYLRFPRLAAYARARHGPAANGQDAVLDFANAIGNLVRARGRRQRVWSDGEPGGSAVWLDPRAVVEWWENRASRSPAALAARGHRLLNVGWWPLYYVTGGPVQSLRARLDQMYSEWDPWRFEGPYTARWITGNPVPAAQTLAPGDPHLLGASLAIWNDQPNTTTPQDIATGALPRLRIVAQKTWGSPPLAADQAAFEAIAERVAPVH
jgi:hexosaminidase